MLDTRYQPLRHDPYPYRHGGAAEPARAACGEARAFAPLPPGLPARLGGLLAVWFRRWHERCELGWMAENHPDALLDDIGVTRDELWRESRKPFWRP